MSIPTTIKYNANGAIYDSMGNNSTEYIASYSTETAIYFLTTTNGDVIKWDFYSEEETIMKAITGSDDGASYLVKSIIVENDNVYGFRGRSVRKFKNNQVLYIENGNLNPKEDTLLTYESLDFKIRSKEPNFGKSTLICGVSSNIQAYRSIVSNTKIHDFVIDTDNNVTMIHGNTNPTISKYTDSFKLLYKINVLKILTTQKISQLLAIDLVREYTPTGIKQYPIVLCKDTTNNLALFKVDEKNETITDFKFLGLSLNAPCVNSSTLPQPIYNLTNFSYLKENHPQQEFSFKLKLTNTQNNHDMLIVNIPVDVSLFTTGAHHFALRLDSEQGNVSVFVDGGLYKNVNIPLGTYVFQDISQDGIAVGCTGFYDNVPLFKYLKQNNYYFVDNSYIKQFKLYNTALTDNEIRFLTYNGAQMQDAVLSLPSDQRNELDQIERAFKLNAPANKSNNINILIKNSQINDTNIQDQLKVIIRDRLQQILPANVNINEITFKTY